MTKNSFVAELPLRITEKEILDFVNRSIASVLFTTKGDNEKR